MLGLIEEIGLGGRCCKSRVGKRDTVSSRRSIVFLGSSCPDWQEEYVFLALDSA